MTIAFWCVFVAALLPYVPFGFASTKLDPHAPRLGAPALEGLAARAYGAHLNGFEAFPFFAAAVIVSHIVEGANATVGWLALAFVARAARPYGVLSDGPAAPALGVLLRRHGADRRHLHPSGLPLRGLAEAPLL